MQWDIGQQAVATAYMVQRLPESSGDGLLLVQALSTACASVSLGACLISCRVDRSKEEQQQRTRAPPMALLRAGLEARGDGVGGWFLMVLMLVLAASDMEPHEPFGSTAMTTPSPSERTDPGVGALDLA
ncbi:hypothetical protein E2562_010823 [Oryza meyeriana var. granulata]|uniref:Uncharacterized protein n=1 Tax=Oryza meyeriana var. granulata TaxID=110450 RepID=A0A6G1BJK4_9ORYZ|nr:hypothetical protein E2562_010823 [Oryza meyeriana var. granulata]